MTQLLDAIDLRFEREGDFEFSVEIDPTEAAPEILSLLAERGMRRASICVQDFDPKVQAAIGRQQSFRTTHFVVDGLQSLGVESLNVDLLYGLPFQTKATLQATLALVQGLFPDRLVLYGYAYVPQVSKRQVMIPVSALPDAEARFYASRAARSTIVAAGFDAVGIDHFARPTDSLAKAGRSGTLKRNFQGYTDDPCDTLIGFGASAISNFPEGFSQNAVATAAYQKRIRDGRLASHKGHVMTPEDRVISDVIDQIMCQGRLDPIGLTAKHPRFALDINDIVQDLRKGFLDALEDLSGTLQFRQGMEALTRVVAARVDAAREANNRYAHSAAI